MARRQQAYDLNKQVRLLDIHRQFMGGLKTIDTDDALGSAYLRDVDNLSISEFGFLEKRYGTYVNDELNFESFSLLSDVDLTKPIQGYFEYIDDNGGVHKIIFIDGVGYIKQPDDNLYRRVNAFSTEPGFDYPDAEEVIKETNWESTGIVGQSIENLSIQLNFRIDASDQIELTRNVFSNISLNPDIRRFDIKTFDSSTEVNLSLNPDIIKVIQDVQVIDHFVDANLSLNPDIIKVIQEVQVITSFVDANLSLNEDIKRFDIKSLSKTHSVTIALNESITKFEQDPPDNQTLTRTKNGIIHLNESITKFEQDPPPPIQLDPPILVGFTNTSTTITVTISNTNPVDVFYEADLNQGLYDEADVGDVQVSANSSRTFTFSGLSPSTSYDLVHRFNPGVGVTGYTSSQLTFEQDLFTST